MRVLVTGATGFVGAHAVHRLQTDGHQVAVLIRSRERLEQNAGSIGVDIDGLDVRMGDMGDAGAVADAVDGAEAVIHAAAVVATLIRSDAQRIIDANVNGAQTVVTAAAAAGARRIVYLSSVAALFTPHVPVLTADLPPALGAASPYMRSKAQAEQWVREQQAAGVPVISVYPGGVTGPPAGAAFGEVSDGFVSMLRAGFVQLGDGAINFLDVRDLAQVLAGICTAETLSTDRFMTGGVFTTLPQIAAILRTLTGRRLPLLPVPGAVFRGLGHVVDTVRRVVDFETVFTAEAMQLLTLAQPTDDRAVTEHLRIAFRDPAESIEAALRGLHAAGKLTGKQVGRLADS